MSDVYVKDPFFKLSRANCASTQNGSEQRLPLPHGFFTAFGPMRVHICCSRDNGCDCLRIGRKTNRHLRQTRIITIRT